MNETIGIGSDHGGRILKQAISNYLKSHSFEVEDYGVPSDDSTSVDYPDYAEKLANDIASQKLRRGILVCGTGIGIGIAANKVKGIRAATVWDEDTARLSREHNDTNILCLGERVVPQQTALKLVEIWLNTEFEGGRHQRRIDKIMKLEQ